MKRGLQLLLCLVAALHLVGGHWGVMQMVAWASMVTDYSKERGLLQGVKDTFDGEHPCPMCRQIAENKEKEEQQNLPNSTLWQDNLAKWFALSPTTGLPEEMWSEGQESKRPDSGISLGGRGDAAPPVPPPERLI